MTTTGFYKFSGKQFHQDKDVNIEKYDSPMLKALYNEYTSLYGHGEDGYEITFLDKNNECFFSFGDSSLMMADMTLVSGEDRTQMDEFACNVAYLMCIYTAELQREKGVQVRLLQRLINLAEETQNAFYTVADPFHLNVSKFAMDVRSEMISFFADGHTRHIPTWCDDCQNQIERFRKAGLQNFRLPNAHHTDHAQQFIYIPKSLSKDHRIVLESLLEDKAFDCGQSMGLWDN